ncbi:hypothetical protein LAZ40_23195 [Cereibacter sphaeroides]|uniref:hypothetical protein n=1 Tax=Rhodobacterales TaxID=204455 RepID=UPI000BBF3690|nr:MULTISPECIES: hypothetical protein [Paracoccaceae]MCE6952954.1 hypothetical protein [Cereibacter sphaeroides]MCE6961948.1 hypothetical protein [Cereibacter sphaeroides]MCE6970723.1 hypothetical protein [Cereibacter sphaeroides]MCE6975681.1 hypothetical protein [Cereibacter sphaeroides]
MSESLSIGAPRLVIAAPAPAEAEELPDAEGRLPSGWWLLPSVIGGCGFWVALGFMLF